MMYNRDKSNAFTVLAHLWSGILSSMRWSYFAAIFALKVSILLLSSRRSQQLPCRNVSEMGRYHSPKTDVSRGTDQSGMRILLQYLQDCSEAYFAAFYTGSVDPDCSHHFVYFKTNQRKCCICPSVCPNWRFSSGMNIDVVYIKR